MTDKERLNAIAKILGVEIGEEFYCEYGNNHRVGVYKLENNTISCKQKHKAINDIDAYVGLLDALLGRCAVVKMPWQPQMFDKYYYPSVSAQNICVGIWNGSTSDFALRKLNMIYKTFEKAQDNLQEDLKKLEGE